MKCVFQNCRVIDGLGGGKPVRRPKVKKIPLIEERIDRLL